MTTDEQQPRPGDPGYPQHAQEQMRAGYRGAAGLPPTQVMEVTCPACHHVFEVEPPTPPIRVTETAPATEAAAKAAPYGDVEYADPGLQADGKKRYPLDTEKRVRAAWSYINQPNNAAKYSKSNLSKVKARIKAALRKLGVTVTEAAATEAMIDGKLSHDDMKALVRDALALRVQQEQNLGRLGYYWVWVADMTDTDVVYTISDDDGLWQCSYAIDGAGSVTLGEPARVVRAYAPAPAADDDQEAPVVVGEAVRETVGGRVLEAKGTDADGGRVFRVQIIAYGTSRNRRRYPEAVLREAVPLYEGAVAFDRHRDQAAISAGSTVGLVGHYRAVEATQTGLEADLHLLPSAVATAEALDAALQAEAAGVTVPLGISHDAYAVFRPVSEGSEQIQEATAITRVQSADVVVNPAAGGKPVRVVAGGEQGTEDDPAQDGDETGEPQMTTPTVTTDAVLGALGSATAEQLAAAGLQRVTESAPTIPPTPATPPAPEPTAPQHTTEAGVTPKTSYLGRLMIRDMATEAGLAAAVGSITDALPDYVTEAAVGQQIAAVKSTLGILERAGLAPTAPANATVLAEALDKKIKALEATFAAGRTGDWSGAYRSFRTAYMDITGQRAQTWTDGDLNLQIMRESVGRPYDSQLRAATRASESLTTASWDVILGDSITRQMIAEYRRPGLQSWRRIVSAMPPIADFRTVRRERLGGYGVLPEVGQGAPYQPLTSPPDEESTYAITKKGGTEDLTFEMIANDDIHAIANIPFKLGLAAAQTLYRFVWDMLATNVTCTFDSTALFHTNHANTTAAALSQTALSGRRAAMRGQAAYGDSSDILSIVPLLLVVPSALEELAFQLTRSAVAVPSTPAGPSDTPNIHANMDYEVVDYWSDTNDWFVVCDPSLCPTIEVGFYQGRQEPELFTQSDQTVGVMFDTDKVKYKIRHIYKGTPLDYRGFQRGTQ